MSHALRITLVFVSALALLAALLVGSYALSLHALDVSQSHWCTTLTLLTSEPVAKPVDPQANVSRERAYIFYTNLKTLERDFGC